MAQAIAQQAQGKAQERVFANANEVLAAVADGSLPLADGQALIASMVADASKPTKAAPKLAFGVRRYEKGEGRDGRVDAHGVPMFALGAPRVDLRIAADPWALKTSDRRVVSLTPDEWAFVIANASEILDAIASKL